jgi:ADP-ribosylglycohydrolase
VRTRVIAPAGLAAQRPAAGRDRGGTFEPVPVDRVTGCLLGGAIGDALGASVEFDSLAEIRRRYGPAGLTDFASAYGRPNAVTDDTQMTVLTAAGLVEARATAVPPTDVLWRLYRHWAAHQNGVVSRRPPPPAWLPWPSALTAVRAPGMSCLSGLRLPRPGTAVSPANPHSKGCGAVMRSAPFGLATADPERAWSEACAGAVLTHGHPSGVLSAAALAWLICRLSVGVGLDEALDSVEERLAAEGQSAAECRYAVSAGRRLGQGTVSAEALEQLGGGWTGEEALAIAVACVGDLPPAPTGAEVRRSLLRAVNHSGDSDSTASIAGSIAGTMAGADGLPARWADTVEGADLIRLVAARLVAARLLAAAD